jgi:hypothetical protein
MKPVNALLAATGATLGTAMGRLARRGNHVKREPTPQSHLHTRAG